MRQATYIVAQLCDVSFRYHYRACLATPAKSHALQVPLNRTHCRFVFLMNYVTRIIEVDIHKLILYAKSQQLPGCTNFSAYPLRHYKISHCTQDFWTVIHSLWFRLRFPPVSCSYSHCTASVLTRVSTCFNDSRYGFPSLPCQSGCMF